MAVPISNSDGHTIAGLALHTPLAHVEVQDPLRRVKVL